MAYALNRALYLWVFLVLLFWQSIGAAAQTVTLPVTIEYPLLRTLIANRAFPEQGDSVTLINEGDRCINLVLSDPQVTEKNGVIRLEMGVFVHAGTPLAGNCYTPLQWQGYLVLHQQPSVAPGSWRLSFSTLSSELLGADRQPAQIAGLLWGLIESHVFSYLGGITIDLTPPVTDLKSFLIPLFPEQVQGQTEKMLASLRPGDVRVEPDSVNFDILADVEAVYKPNDAYLLEKLKGESLDRMVAVWENWDSFLSYLVVSLSRQLLSEDEQQILMDVLLETRHEFVAGMSDKSMTHDFVRGQFVSAWQQLGPIFRNRLYRDVGPSQALGYLAFVSSADALLVFDRLGPTIGLEISGDGLVRLAHMLRADPSLLLYRSITSPDLQKLFQIGPDQETLNRPASPESPATEEKDEEKSLPQSEKPLSWLFEHLRLPDAVAAQPTLKDILPWKVPDNDVGNYVKRVEKILHSSSRAILKKGEIPKPVQAMFRLLIPAMAWQESCFRQFVVKDNTLTYLLSYNQSSVGLMQVNERVWRGLYNRERLRWDINYNAVAGSEIAALYLKKYALRDVSLSKKIDTKTLARLVYALYNGGPSQQKKFLKRLKAKKLFSSDKLFWEKYSWVSSGKVDKVSVCLTGS